MILGYYSNIFVSLLCQESFPSSSTIEALLDQSLVPVT